MEPDVDFAHSSSWDAEMPARLERLRENHPSYWSEKTGAFIVTRFEDVIHVSKHNEVFCSGEGVLPGAANPKIGMIDEDEPRHGEMRGLINRGFTPRMVKKWEAVFQQITDDALDSIAGRDECDFVEEVAVPLPLILIAEMIGIRKEDRARFHQWSDHMILAQGNFDKPEIAARAGQAAVEYIGYVTQVIEDRRREPKDDLISVLVRAKDDGVLKQLEGRMSAADTVLERDEASREMSNDELIKMCILLMVAGNETTRNGLSGGLQLLIENPEARQRLVENPDLIPDAVEEMLRLTSPVLSFLRTATQDTELRGTPIRAGQKVLMIYGAANRDPRQFEDPTRFDIDRKPQHLAFGIGNHFCLGANLARMELRVAFRELLRRFPDMEYSDGGPKFAPSALVRSVSELRVRYTPEDQRKSA